VVVFFALSVHSQPIVKIVEAEYSEQLKKYAHLFLQELDVHENIHLTVDISAHVNMPENFKGITFPIAEVDSFLVFRILFDPESSLDKQLLILAHEMVHVKQFVKKELIVLREDLVIWKGGE